MSVRFDGGAIRVEGDCRVEDAEPLLRLLQAHEAPVDLSRCGRLHAAPFQVLLALRPVVIGIPSSDFVRERLLPMLIATLPESSPAR